MNKEDEVIGVREYKSVADMRKAYKQIKARLNSAPPRANKPSQPRGAFLYKRPVGPIKWRVCDSVKTLNDLDARRPTAIAILRCVSKVSRISIDDMTSPRRTANIAIARFAAYYLLRRLTCQSYPWIGILMHRDHSTVLNGCQVVSQNQDPYAHIIKAVEAELDPDGIFGNMVP